MGQRTGEAQLKQIFDHRFDQTASSIWSGTPDPAADDRQINVAFSLIKAATQNGGLQKNKAQVEGYLDRLATPAKDAGKEALAAALAFEKASPHADPKDFFGDADAIFDEVDRVTAGGQTFAEFQDGYGKTMLVEAMCNDAAKDGFVQPLEKIALRAYGKLLGERASLGINETLLAFKTQTPEQLKNQPVVKHPLTLSVRPADVAVRDVAGAAEVQAKIARFNVNNEVPLRGTKGPLHLHFGIGPSLSTGVSGSASYVTAGADFTFYVWQYAASLLKPEGGILGTLVNSEIEVSEEGGVAHDSATNKNHAINNFKAGINTYLNRPSDNHANVALSYGFADRDGHAGGYLGLNFTAPWNIGANSTTKSK